MRAEVYVRRYWRHRDSPVQEGCLDEDDPLCPRVWKRRDGAKKWGQASRGRE